MSLSLAAPGPQYNQTDEAQTRKAIQDADAKNVKTDGVIQKLQFMDTATGEIRTVVMTSGALVIS